MTPNIKKLVSRLGLGMVCAVGLNLMAVASPTTTQEIEITAKERETIHLIMKIFAESQGASDLYPGFLRGEPVATAKLLELGQNPMKDRPAFDELPQELQAVLMNTEQAVMYRYLRQRALAAAAHPDAPPLAYSLAARLAADRKGGLEPDYQAAYRYAVKAREAGLPIDEGLYQRIAELSGEGELPFRLVISCGSDMLPEKCFSPTSKGYLMSEGKRTDLSFHNAFSELRVSSNFVFMMRNNNNAFRDVKIRIYDSDGEVYFSEIVPLNESIKISGPGFY